MFFQKSIIDQLLATRNSRELRERNIITVRLLHILAVCAEVKSLKDVRILMFENEKYAQLLFDGQQQLLDVEVSNVL